MGTSRKMDHVHYALKFGQSGKQGLADIEFVPNCIPEVSMHSIDLRTKLGGIALQHPIIINAMTGGSPETEDINRELAIVAREKKLAMAVGSQMSAIRNKDVISSYQVVRRMNPHGVLFANLGSEATLEQAKHAVEMIGADALQIHLNVMQELIMPEGDRDFRGMLDRIAAIVEGVSVPVIIKEVGFGIMRESAAKLKALGAKLLDVGGAGGTNFARIENSRRSIPLQWLNQWGSTTSIALLEVAQQFASESIIASGGITNSLEIAKALSLGAVAVGIAGTFLRVLRSEGIEALLNQVDEMTEGLKLVMTALGKDTIKDLWNAPLIITGKTAEWCNVRGIDLRRYATRKDE